MSNQNSKSGKIDYKVLLEGCVVEIEEFLNSRKDAMLDFRHANLPLHGIGAEGAVMAISELAEILNKYYFTNLDDSVLIELSNKAKKQSS